ncbi:ATPase [Candidatus Micrarchaeota archaeon]|nr:ATPase [Candidatus Micrarchaeota archaeon]
MAKEREKEDVGERIKTGIYGLDELIGGGFLRGRTILVSGACGTGKSILSLQFIYRGALEYKEPGVYVTFDEIPEKVREDMLAFGWNFKALEEKNLVAIFDASSARAGTPSDEEHALMPGELNFDKILVDVLTLCRDMGAKRLVIDSIPAIGSHLGEKEGDIRKAILKLAYIIARSGLTTIITSEVPEQGSGQAATYSKYGVEEYIADGVILLRLFSLGDETSRTLYIRKMRGTNHRMEIYPLEIGDRGIVVKKANTVLRFGSGK